MQKRVRVGVPASIEPELLRVFGDEADVVRIATDGDERYEIDLWIPPVYPREAKQVYARLSGVRVAQSLLAGVDWLLALVSPDVTVCDAQEVHNAGTAEWVVFAVLASLKYSMLYAGLQRAHDWRGRSQAPELHAALHQDARRYAPPVQAEELAGKTVLIVGYGSIGQTIERMLSVFDVTVVRVARTEREGVHPVERLAEFLPQADVVVLIVPLTSATTGLIHRDVLARMKQGALLVNAARGPVVDGDALVEALQAGRIRAAVDVADPEPLPEDHPLWSAPNLLITPHIAGATPRFMERALRLAADQAARMARGEPLVNVVSGEY